MNGRKYSYYVLLVLAAAFAVANLVSYIQAGIENSEAFRSNWIMLLTAVAFILALVFMPQKNAVGWVSCLVGMLILTFQTLMSLQTSGLTGITAMCLDLFVVFYLLDDYILGMFHIS